MTPEGHMAEVMAAQQRLIDLMLEAVQETLQAGLDAARNEAVALDRRRQMRLV